MPDLNPRATVVLRSKEKVTRKPDYASVGGFCVTPTNEETSILFDWESSAGYSEIDKDGYLEISWMLSGFDMDFFLGSNEGLTEPDWELILSSALDEVYYEAVHIIGGIESHIEMTVQSFGFLFYDFDKNEETNSSFTHEQIKAYNQKIEKELVVN
ncbi:hypothetical protein LAV82_23615 [Bacillus sp. ILBB4]|nr:hypothetical protein [Bacillus sp. ILBB4]